MTKYFQINLLEELKNKYFKAYKDHNQIKQDSIKNSNPKTYYDLAMSEYNAELLSIEPFKIILNWINSVISSVNSDELTYFQKAKTEFEDILSKTRPMPIESDFLNYIDEDAIRFYLDKNDLPSLDKLLKYNKVPSEWITAQTGKKIFVFEYGNLWVVEPDNNGSLSYYDDSAEWVEDAQQRYYEFFPEEDFTKVFWDDVGYGTYLYHATSEENIPSILNKGLLASSETRGIENRSMGNAVFGILDSNIDDVHAALSSYGDNVVRIDLGAMKNDNYMPDVEKETPIIECEEKNALANLIGDDNYQSECGSDYMPDTIAIYGDVPPKYLKIL